MWSHLIDGSVNEVEKGGDGSRRFQLALLVLRKRLLVTIKRARRERLKGEIADLRAKVAELKLLQQASYSYPVAGKIKSLLWQWDALAEELESLDE